MSFRNVQFAVLVRLQLELHCGIIDIWYKVQLQDGCNSTFGQCCYGSVFDMPGVSAVSAAECLTCHC